MLLFTAVPQMPRTGSDTRGMLNDVMTDSTVQHMCACVAIIEFTLKCSLFLTWLNHEILLRFDYFLPTKWHFYVVQSNIYKAR